MSSFPDFWQEGVRQGPAWRPRDDRQLSLLKLSQKVSLTDISREYTFYTTAVVFKTVPMTADPFQTFCEENNYSWQQLSLRFDKPIFHGLGIDGDREWNYVLFALPHEQWQAYQRYMGTVAFVDSARQEFYRLRHQAVHIVDPCHVSPITEIKQLPKLLIHAFCVEARNGCALLVETPHAFWLPPYYKFFDNLHYADNERFAKAVLAEQANPYREVEGPSDSHG